MTEAEWAACADTGPMLGRLRGRATARKRRLYACACCRRIWHLIRDERSRAAVEVAERFADGRATADELAAAHALAYDARHLSGAAAWAATEPDPAQTEWAGVWVCDHGGEARADLTVLLRDVYGPRAFRRLPDARRWRSAAAVAVARGLYERRDFGPLPVLADALADAGCDDPEVLGHCRDPGPHARGCWVVDLVLGKR